MKRAFRALTTNVLVDFDESLECAELLASLVGTYEATSEPPDVEYTLTRDAMVRDGFERSVSALEDLPPVFELDLYEQVIGRARGWVLHAAGILTDRGALVLVGPSGAGKTTLSLALVRRGYRLLTEEMVAIDARGQTRGLTRPLHVRDDEQLPAGWSWLAYPLRRRDGSHMIDRLALPPVQTLVHAAVPLCALVRLTHGEDRVPGLEPLNSKDAFAWLWDASMRADRSAMSVATTIIQRFPAYRLASTSFDQALELFEPLLATNSS